MIYYHTVLSMIMTELDVPEQYHEFSVPFFKDLVIKEQMAANVFSYWVHRIPLDPKLDELRVDLCRSAYDEARHRNISEDMLRRFGGQEAVDEMHEWWEEVGDDQWQTRMTTYLTYGVKNYIEFLTTTPLMGDSIALYFFQDAAECSPDPVWTDVAESLVEDEKLHLNLAAEYLPPIIEEHGEKARRSVEEGLKTWMLPLFAIHGHPEKDKEHRQAMIDAGFVSKTSRELHETLLEHVHEVMDPLGINVPELDEDEMPKANELMDYSENIYNRRVENGVVRPRREFQW